MIRFSLHSIFVLMAACAMWLSIPASAQDAEGDCRPHTKEEGPWSCLITKMECAGEQHIQLDPVWAAVNSAEDSYLILKNKYVEINDANAFVQWLACQRFRVYATSTGRVKPAIVIDAGYLRSEIEPYPIRWWDVKGMIGLRFSERYVVELDEFGQVRSVSLWPYN